MLRVQITVGALILVTMVPPISAQPPEPVAVIAHPSVPAAEMSRAELIAVFTMRMRHWDDGSSISVVSYPVRSPLRTQFDQSVLGMSPNESARYWIDYRIRGGQRLPRTAPNAHIAARVIQRLRGSIAYVPHSAVPDSVKILAIIDGRLVRTPNEVP